MKLLSLSIFCILFLSCSPKTTHDYYKSQTLEVKKITENVYQHVSFLSTNDFGKVACNGMIVFVDGEVIVLDAPTNDEASEELIDWIKSNLRAEIKAVVGTHFHDDCLGGLEAFHQHGISSYAHQRTIELARSNEYVIPQNGFSTSLELAVGDKPVLVEYFGEGHTIDNVVGYFPGENALFGGCMIKSDGAGKGYLGDANVSSWPLTVAALKEKYPDIEVVIPGHGKPGGPELLDYTIKLFEENK